MKKLLILTLFLAPLAHAQSIPTNALEDASEVCSSFSFDEDECSAIVAKAEYFQKSLVNLCMKLAGMDKEKISCLSTVSNKYVLLEKLVTGCNKGMFWDSTRKCIVPLLKTYTVPVATPTPSPEATATPTPAACNKEKAKLKLESAIEQLKKIKYLDAYESMVDLRYLLKDCGI